MLDQERRYASTASTRRWSLAACARSSCVKMLVSRPRRAARRDRRTRRVPHRTGTRSQPYPISLLQKVALVAAIATAAAAPAMLLYLIAAVDADRIAAHHATPISDLQGIVETITRSGVRVQHRRTGHRG